MLNIAGPNTTSKITNLQPGDVQPNAVDVRLARVFQLHSSSIFTIDETQKVHRQSTEIFPDENNYWNLPTGTYEVQMDNIVTIGDDEAGWVIVRSTLNRNGIVLTSGLYDSGYSGAMAACMHVLGGPLSIQKGTRIGQFITVKAEALHKYNGSYGFDANGKPKTHEQKYHTI